MAIDETLSAERPVVSELVEEIRRLQRQMEQSRVSGCWCDEGGRPCRGCDISRERAELEATIDGLRHWTAVDGEMYDLTDHQEVLSLVKDRARLNWLDTGENGAINWVGYKSLRDATDAEMRKGRLMKTQDEIEEAEFQTDSVRKHPQQTVVEVGEKP